MAGHNHKHLKEFLDKAAKNPDMSESLGYHSALSLFSLVVVSNLYSRLAKALEEARQGLCSTMVNAGAQPHGLATLFLYLITVLLCP